MKPYSKLFLVLLFIFLSTKTGNANFEKGVRLKVDGQIIDTDMGHLVPWVTDWNGDGKKDLIVGQFNRGKIRLYLNTGSDHSPVLTDGGYLKATGREIRLPAG